MFTKEQFTTVTPLSKALAMIVFVILPFAAFFLGMSYGQQSLPPVTTEVITTNDNVSKVDTSSWQAYRNEELGFAFSYPSEWGEVQIKRANIDAIETGEEYFLSFSAKEESRASFRTPDHKVKEGFGRGGAYWDAPETFSHDFKGGGGDISWDGDDARKLVERVPNRFVYLQCSDYTVNIEMSAIVMLDGKFEAAKFYYLLGSGDRFYELREGCNDLHNLFKPIQEEYLEFIHTIEAI